MSTQETTALAENYDRIWLGPLCEIDERSWCQDPQPCDDCGLPAIEYVRADLAMRWERADKAKVDEMAYYVVQHNGHEWRDFDLAVMSGALVAHRLRPEWVRGRPEWIARINRPSTK